MTDPAPRLQTALAGRYTVERELGRGGMATVYLAQDLKHGRPVAIKVLRPELAAVLGRDRFLREIAITAGLQHPHILALLDSGEAEGSLYYVMPFVAGESLRDRLARERQLPLDDALRITREVADALDYAHRQGLIHRDIKPENILLSDRHAMVADFGIARAVEQAGGDKLTETGLAVGTPDYMSPEQAAGSAELDGRTDQYSLACLLYEMLCGHPPFLGKNPQEIRARHALDPVPPLRSARATVSDALDAVLQRALAKQPADRFATMDAFTAALSRPDPPAAIPIGAKSGRRTLTKAALAIGMGALLVGGAILWPAASPVPVSATRIAVLPLLPTGSDTAAARLGRDLVVTLSTNLDGLGEIEVVDANTILSQTASNGRPLSLPAGAALARKLGARSVIRGSLVRSVGRVRADLGLFDTGDLSELAHASVTTDAEDLFSLTDSLTWSLVEQIWRKGKVPSPSTLAAVTTHSVPALRAFLEGEQLLVSGQLDSAAGAYRRAFTADSAFWLAYFRYAYIFNWLERGGADSMSDIAWQHRDALPDRERELLEITRQDTMSRVLARSQAFVSRYPDYWPGWFQYADYLTHNSGRLGYSKSDQLAALERTVALNPKLFFGWEHLMVVALPDNHAEASRALSKMAELGHGAIFYEGRDYDELPGWRLLVGTARTYPAFDVALTDSVAHIIAAAHARPNWMVRVGFLIYGFPATQIQLNRRTLRLPVGQERATDLRFRLAAAWAHRGAWDSAMVALESFVAEAPTESGAGPTLGAYRLAVYGAWLKAVDPVVATKWRSRLAEALKRFPGSLDAQSIDEISWLDGLLADAEGTRGSLTVARRNLIDDTTEVVRPYRRSLAAFDGALVGSYRQATDSITALIKDVAEDLACCPGEFDAINRLAATNWSLAVGDTTAALAMLGDIGAIFGPQHVIFDSPMYLERGRIREALGQKDGARHDYQQFLQRYDMPVPAHRHLVDEAQSALRRLDGQVDAPALNRP